MTDQSEARAAVDQALETLKHDEKDAEGWRALALALDQSGLRAAALEAQWAAMRLRPDRSDWLPELRRLADQAGGPALAEGCLRDCLDLAADRQEAVRVLADFLRDERRPGEAIEILRQAIPLIRSPVGLYNQLAAILGELGDMREALQAVEAALALAPGWPPALQNRANIRLALGDIDGAIADGVAGAAASKGREQASIRLAHALALLRGGRLEEGWRAYGARLDPAYVDALRFDIPLPRWTADQALTGLRLLLVGEQGLADEIMFASVIPDLLARTARLGLAVIPRLVPLFARSFPGAETTSHYTRVLGDGAHRSAPLIDLADYDAYAPMADVMSVLRPTVDAFPERGGYLRPAPERVAHWRAMLAGLPPGPKIGLCWKSFAALNARQRFYAPFDLWRPVFEIPGATVVNLQYGDITEEIATARAWGRPLWQAPGLDVRDDLDDLAALASVLDGVTGPLNASTALAAAVGAPLAAVMVREAWHGLGTDRLPWFPQSLLAAPSEPRAWAPAIARAVAFLQPPASPASRAE
jgi:tetratricopeptide (TPR) repeat protein